MNPGRPIRSLSLVCGLDGLGAPSGDAADRAPGQWRGGLDSLGGFALSRSRKAKRWIVLLLDAAICAACCYVAIFLRLGFLPERDTPYGLLIVASIGLALPIFHGFGLYREIFSQSGIRAITAIARACLVYALAFMTLFTFIGVWGIPRTLSLIQPLLLFVAVAGSRLFARSWLFGTHSLRRRPRRRVIIYGAGSAGRQLSAAISQSAEMAVVGFLDDNPALHGSVLDGCRIYAPDDLALAAERLTADEILLALPSAPIARRKAIITLAQQAGVRVRTLPGLIDIADGRVEVRQIRDVEIGDLLGRDPVEPDRALMRQSIAGRVALVTGAGGSIGSELSRQLLGFAPDTLLLLETSEHSLYQIHRQLERRAAEQGVATRLIPLLGSVDDPRRVEQVLRGWRPDTIYHAAAYKHVPMVEHNPAEGVRTNVFGTLVLAEAAARCGVANFVLVSTDKAVRPANVMGASKRVAELIVQALEPVSPRTRFSIVRFGNVLGTSGSVVPLFQQQIRDGGPVTISDQRVTRYFMTAPEAAELVLQAGAMASGGEVFLLDMGDPVRITDLARNMIALAGLTVRDEAHPHGDIALVEIGLRPGEKLFEELLIADAPLPTRHPRIRKGEERFLPLPALRRGLAQLERALRSGEAEALLAALQALVPEFDGSRPAADWLALEARRTAPVARTA